MNFKERLKRLLSGEPHPEPAPGSRSITCMEALEKVYEYLDGELDEASHKEVERHFSLCKQCYPHLELEERFLELLHSAKGDEKAPLGLREQVLALLSQEAGEKG